jgi:hypothetical protein
MATTMANASAARDLTVIPNRRRSRDRRLSLPLLHWPGDHHAASWDRWLGTERIAGRSIAVAARMGVQDDRARIGDAGSSIIGRTQTRAPICTVVAGRDAV